MSAVAILAIDDDPHSLDAVRAAMRYLRRPVSLYTATGGVDGLSLLHEHVASVRVVVLDVHMPHLDGRWVCAEIRRTAPQVQILPFTGDADAGEQLHELGARAALAKPATPIQIAECLSEALSEES